MQIWQDGQIIDAPEDYVVPIMQMTITEADYTVAIAAMMDAKAKERRYDSALSLSTYVASDNPTWAAEAHTFVTWRDAVWAYCYIELAKVAADQRSQPTVSDFLTELLQAVPLTWPAA